MKSSERYDEVTFFVECELERAAMTKDVERGCGKLRLLDCREVLGKCDVATSVHVTKIMIFHEM